MAGTLIALRDPRAAGHEVLWRATTSPDWEQAHAVEEGTRATLAPSRDNVFFAVRAVDKDGYRSLPVIPSLAFDAR